MYESLEILEAMRLPYRRVSRERMANWQEGAYLRVQNKMSSGLEYFFREGSKGAGRVWI